MDHATVFTRTGLVLWSQSYHPLQGDPVNSLIHNVLLQDRGHLKSYEECPQYSVRYTTANDVDLVFVIVISKVLSARLPYIDLLLKLFKRTFVNTYGVEVKGGVTPDTAPFGLVFKQLTDKARAKRGVTGRGSAGAAARRQRQRDAGSDDSDSSDDSDGEGDDDGDDGDDGDGDVGGDARRTQSGGQSPSEEPVGVASSSSSGADDAAAVAAAADSGSTLDHTAATGDATGDDDGAGVSTPNTATDASPRRSMLDVLKRRTRGGRGGGRTPGTTPRKGKRGGSGGGGGAGAGAGSASGGKPGKRLAESDKLTPAQMAALNRGPSAAGAGGVRAEMFGSAEDEPIRFESDSDDDGESESKSGGASWFGRTRIGSLFASLSGGRVLAAEDVREPLEALGKQLMAKNVAKEIADSLCASVEASLVGRTLERFTTIGSVVQTALRSAIERILTPKTSTDLLLKVEAKKRTSSDPFTIVFIGVNGVGKSTSLSKVTYLLKSNGHSPLIAACDTFRSGAVEQLGVHSRNLNVPLFERGYEKEAAMVARDAIRFAKAEGHDVVMIDTAGRMQNNAPLMQSLANLVALNKPDLVLFVGEALVGNDGIDQLTHFNKALVDFSPPGTEPRRVDGIVLTKFDTIDDKVGAALSMVYRTGQPIMFVGTGQKYTHLHPLNVGFVVRSLLS